MDYIIYMNDNMVCQKLRTEKEGLAALEKLRVDWLNNTGRVPPLKLCYNGFKSVTLMQIGGR